MALASLSIDLVAKLAKFEQGLDKAGRIAEKRAQQIERAFSGVGKALAAGIAGISFGVLMRKFVDETVQAQREQAQLAAVLQSTGMAAGFSREQLNLMAADLAKSSIFSEGDINKAQARLLSYTGIVGEQFPQAMQIVIDMADRMGMSLEQSAETIGRALDVPSQGMQSLVRQGFRFSDEQKKLVEQLEKTGRTAQAQAIVLDALVSSYGGAAKASRDTFGGAIAALQNQLDSLMTGEDGSLEGAREAIEDLTKKLSSPEVQEAFGKLVAALAKIIELTADAGTGFVIFGERIGRGLASITGNLSEFDRIKGEIDDIDATLRSRLLAPNQQLFFASRDELLRMRQELVEEEARLRSAMSGRYEDPRILGDPGSIASQVAAWRKPAPAGGGSSGADTSKWKTGDPKMGPIPLGVEFADLFKDTDIEKARAFRVELAALDELYFSGAIGGEKYDAAMRKLTGSTFTAADATSQFLQDQQRLAELIDAGPAAVLERQRKDMALLAKAYEDGRFGIVGTTEAIKAYGDIVNHTLGNVAPDVKKKLDEMDEFAKQAAGNIQDHMGASIRQALKGDFDGILEDWGNLLLDMAAQGTAVRLNQYLLGDFGKTGKLGGAIGSLFGDFGGLFAEGGTLGAGKWGIAGEAGLELVKGPAQIVPIAQVARAGGGVTVINHFNYDIAPGMSRGEVLQAMQMTREQTKADVYESMRRAGAFAR